MSFPDSSQFNLSTCSARELSDYLRQHRFQNDAIQADAYLAEVARFAHSQALLESRQQQRAASAPIAASVGVMPGSTGDMGRETITYTAPDSLVENVSDASSFQCPSNVPSGSDCVICLNTIDPTKALQIKACNHIFCTPCIKAAVTKDPKCPICRKPVAEPQGKCPSGTMTILTSRRSCSGYETFSTIEIHYNLSGGTQKSYHGNPGTRFHSTSRVAYVPNNADGKALLKRLKYAWSRGLTFTVGTSLTTGRPNSIVWSSIHHKTSMGSGPYGFPDPGFFHNCNDELTQLNVPKAEDL